MNQSITRYLGFGLTVAVVSASIAILNVTPAVTAAAECESTTGGGGGGGGGGSPSPSDGTASPSESDDGGLPITLPPIGGEDSPSPSGTPSEPPGGDDEPQRCRTKLTINFSRSRGSSAAVTFKGRVKSQSKECKGGRNVLLKKIRKGKKRTVGRTVSKRSGAWSIQKRRAKGRYFAKARKRSVGNVRCLAGKSRRIRV